MRHGAACVHSIICATLSLTYTYTCKVTPISRRSCTRKTVASTSFVLWSKTSIFQTGGPAAGIFNWELGLLVVSGEDPSVAESAGAFKFNN